MRRCLESIFTHSIRSEFEVWVVDNASTDNSITDVDRLFPQVRLIRNTNNFGFGQANNQAAREASGDYFFLVTNDMELSSEEVVEFYEKRGNCENYIKEAKYDMAVGHLLLQSFWANEAIFQLMMLAYNLFLLFKMDFAKGTECRQQIKTFRLKYIFLAGKIIRTARSVIMKLSEKYPYREMYEQSFA